MSPTVQAAIITGDAALLGVVLGALPTYFIARSQHRMALKRLLVDKWWDRKEQAYSEIVGSLTSLTYSLQRWLDAQVRHITSEEALRPIRDEHARATQQVQMVAIKGSYAISERTAAALSDLIKQLEKCPGRNTAFFDFLDEQWAASKECLEIVRSEAESDLRTRVE